MLKSTCLAVSFIAVVCVALMAALFIVGSVALILCYSVNPIAGASVLVALVAVVGLIPALNFRV